MFLFAKLIGLSGTLLSSGVAISFLVPYFQNKGQNLVSSLIYKENSSTGKFDLSALNQKAERNIKELKKQIQKLSSAKEIANNLKNSAHKNISSNLDELSKKEKQLNNLYGEIYNYLKKLITRRAKIFQLSLQKIETNKEKNLNGFFDDSYSQLNTLLTSWETIIKEIKCEVDNCDKNWSNVLNWIKSFVPFISYLEVFFKSKEEETNSEESEKTKKKLSEISSELSKLLSTIEKKNETYRSLQINSKINRLLSTNQLSSLQELIAKLTQEQDNLEETIKSLMKEATQLIDVINDVNNQLKNWIFNFTHLRSWEISLHNWNTKLKESLFHYQNNLES